MTTHDVASKCEGRAGRLSPGHYVGSGTVGLSQDVIGIRSDVEVESAFTIDVANDGSVTGSVTYNTQGVLANQRIEMNPGTHYPITGDRLQLYFSADAAAASQEADVTRQDCLGFSGTVRFVDPKGAARVAQLRVGAMRAIRIPASCKDEPTIHTVVSHPASERRRVSDISEFLATGRTEAAATVAKSSAPEFQVDGSGKVVSTKITMSITTTIRDWETGDPPPDAGNTAALGKAVMLTEVHEARHRHIDEAAARAAVCAGLGMSRLQAIQAINDIYCEQSRLNFDLDQQEGLLTVKIEAGQIRLSLGPAAGAWSPPGNCRP